MGRRAVARLLPLLAAACAALGGVGPALGTAAAAGLRATAPTGWSGSVKVDSHELNLVSCPSTAFCLAADNNADYLTFNGQTWSTPAPAPDVITHLSCTSSTFCAALGQNDDAFLYNGQSWSTPQTIYNDPSGTLDSLSCGSSSFCVAAGGDTSDVSVIYNGSTWAPPATFDTFSGAGTTYVTALSCRADFCGAGDFKGQLFTFNGGTWSSPTSTVTNVGITTMSCSSSSFCLAYDPNAAGFKFNGSSWGTAATGPDIAISCVSPEFCALADGAIFNGSSWSSSSGIPANDVSCVTTTFCIAVSGNGSAYVFTGAPGGSGPGGSGGASPPNPKVTRIFSSAGKLRVALSCPAGASSCSAVFAEASVTEHLTGGRVTAVSARAHTKRPVLIARGGARLAEGGSRTLTIALNGTGRALLAKFHKLPVRVTVVSSAGRALKTAAIELRSPTRHHH